MAIRFDSRGITGGAVGLGTPGSHGDTEARRAVVTPDHTETWRRGVLWVTSVPPRLHVNRRALKDPVNQTDNVTLLPTVEVRVSGG